MEGKQVVALDEYLSKLRAALDARGTTPFHVTARTDARAAVGLDEALARARAFADAGADAVFVEAPESIDEMTRVRAAVPPAVPCVANMVEGGKTPLRTAGELGAAGHRIIVVPVAALLTVVPALRRVFTSLAADGSTAALAGGMAGFHELNAFLGLEEHGRGQRLGPS
jgi:methylisocitrate lyase